MSVGEAAAPRPASSYQKNLAWLYSLQTFGIKLGLETTHRLLSEIGAGKSATVVHVAGTNGKGSVCAMVESIARAAGKRTGLFTSPHLVTYRERICVNGKMISEKEVENGLATLREMISRWETLPTFFEITTALALKHFSDTHVEFIVLETGLGGRLDSTNAVQSTVSVITPIGLDHQKWLGKTIPEIAAEKAGIIKPNVPVVSAAQVPAAGEVIRVRAAECDAPLTFVDAPYDASPLGLRGAYQKQNAALALAAIRAAGIEPSDDEVARGLGSVEWPARFQRWDERTIIDGAHNPAAAAVLAQTWREFFGEQRTTIVLAVLSDKDVAGILKELAPIAAELILPEIRSERAIKPSDLAQAVASITPTLHCSITPSVAAALELARARSGPILVTGSLHFAGELLAHLRGEPAAFEECTQ